jgi:hypothetical protein
MLRQPSEGQLRKWFWLPGGKAERGAAGRALRDDDITQVSVPFGDRVKTYLYNRKGGETTSLTSRLDFI